MCRIIRMDFESFYSSNLDSYQVVFDISVTAVGGVIEHKMLKHKIACRKEFLFLNITKPIIQTAQLVVIPDVLKDN